MASEHFIIHKIANEDFIVHKMASEHFKRNVSRPRVFHGKHETLYTPGMAPFWRVSQVINFTRSWCRKGGALCGYLGSEGTYGCMVMRLPQ